jgi:Transposase, Mutator family
LLKAAPLSKSAVSRIVGTLKADLETWRTRSLAGLDALGLRVRSAGKVVGVPVLGVVAVLTDSQKLLLALELCPGGETFEAWKAPRSPLPRGRPRRLLPPGARQGSGKSRSPVSLSVRRTGSRRTARRRSSINP